MPVTEISIVMSCYNGERWLSEAIKSVLLQTFQDWELVIIDDGSQDGSADMISDFASLDRRIIPIAKQNTGLPDSLNCGIARAQGEWIARLDADDLCEPNRLAVQLSAVKSNPELVFLGSGLIHVDEDNREVARYPYPGTHRLLLHGMLSSGRFPAHSSAFIRAKTLREIGGYRTRFLRAQDLDLWLRLSVVGKLGAVPDFLVRHRLHEGQVSHWKGGRPRIIYSKAAVISYWLRQKGLKDPISGQEEEFREFLDWIDCQLTRDKTWEYLEFVSDLKARMNQSQANLALFRLLAGAISQPAFFMRLVRKRYGVDDWPQRAAQVWAKRV